MTPHAKKYRAKGDGVTDDAIPLQAWLDDGGGELDNGVYLSSKQLRFPSGCRIEGVHRNVSIIAAHPSFPGGEFFINRDQARDDPPITRGVHFSNFGIRGSTALRENGVGLSLIGVADSLFLGLGISRFKFLVTPANCTKLTFDECESFEGGCAVQPSDHDNINCEGGTGFLGHSQWPNTYIDLINCYWHDLTWTAIDTGLDGRATNWRILRPRIMRVHEAGLFGRITDGSLIDPTIVGVKRRAVSCHGFEGGLERSEMIGGYIADVGAAAIIFADPHDSVIRGVGCFDPAQEALPGGAAIGLDAAISMRGISPGGVHDLLIEECYGSDHTGKASYPVGFFNQTGTDNAAMSNVTVRRNRFGRGWKAGPAAVLEYAGVRGANFVIE